MVSLALVAGPLATAQAMAHAGWAGAGMALQPWWRHAVFYQVDPARFQATGSGTVGDLAGLTSRLDYLQGLGVDAVIVQGAADAAEDPDALETLVREASEHHLHVLMTVSAAMQQRPLPEVLRTVHDWLGVGAGGLLLQSPAISQAPGSTTSGLGGLQAAILAQMRSLPGDRVLLVGSSAGGTYAVPEESTTSTGKRHSGLPGREARRSGDVTLALAPGLPTAATTDAHGLRLALVQAQADEAHGTGSVLHFTLPPATGDANTVALAAALVFARGQAILRFGEEIGLDTAAPAEAAIVGLTASAAPLMQWTPANVQQAPIERPAAPVPTAPGQLTPFGPYRPYVRPAVRRSTTVASAADTAEPAVPPPDLNTKPGFTRGELPVPPVGGPARNVAAEDRDPHSVLEAYRTLLALRGGSPTVEDGSEFLLDQDGEGAVVIVRTPPANARTGGSLLLAANLTDHPATLSLDVQMAGLGLRPAPLRAILATAARPLTGETTSRLELPPHAVFLGELLPTRQVRR